MTAITFDTIDRIKLAYRAHWGTLPALADYVGARVGSDSGNPTLAEIYEYVAAMPDWELAMALDLDAAPVAA